MFRPLVSNGRILCCVEWLMGILRVPQKLGLIIWVKQPWICRDILSVMQTTWDILRRNWLRLFHCPTHVILLCDRPVPCTVYPKKYAHGFVVLCFVVVMQSFIMNSHEVFIHIHQGCFAGTGAIVRLPQCQWSKPDGYGKISQCITTTKQSKVKTVCIFLGIYCTTVYRTLCWGSIRGKQCVFEIRTPSSLTCHKQITNLLLTWINFNPSMDK